MAVGNACRAFRHILRYNAYMVEKSCEICSAPFTVKPYRASKARFCSFACGGKWHMQTRVMPSDHKAGNKWRAGLRPANAFTSEQAREMNKRPPVICTCAECGSEFEEKPWIVRQNYSKSGRRFCSRACFITYSGHSLKGEKSPQWVGGITTYRGKGWLEQRALAIKRDRGSCQRCAKVVGASIPVHHIKPFRLFATAAAANDLTNLQCLCQPCHMKVERGI